MMEQKLRQGMKEMDKPTTSGGKWDGERERVAQTGGNAWGRVWKQVLDGRREPVQWSVKSSGADCNWDHTGSYELYEGVGTLLKQQLTGKIKMLIEQNKLYNDAEKYLFWGFLEQTWLHL